MVWCEDSVCSICPRDRSAREHTIPLFELCDIISNKKNLTATIQTRCVRTLSCLRMATLTNVRIHGIYSRRVNAYQDLDVLHTERRST